MAEDIRGGLWSLDLDKELAAYNDVYGKYLQSASGARKAQLDAIKANARARGLEHSGVLTGGISNFAEGLQRADLGMAFDIANARQGIKEAEYGRRYDEHSQARAWNEQANQARKQKNQGWGSLLGGIAGMAMGGNPYAGLMDGGA